MVESLLLTTVNQFINSTSLGVVVVLILIAISIVLLSLVKLRKNGIEDNKKTKLKWVEKFFNHHVGRTHHFCNIYLRQLFNFSN